jgi:hypothetical protein
VSLILTGPHGLWQVIDRSGKVVDHVVNACTCGGIATADAVWLAREGNGSGESIVRIAMDRATGRLSTHQDTMVTGLFTSFTLTADGSGMVRDDGTYDFSVWALDMADVLGDRYPDSRRIAHASSPVNAFVSPDGARLLVRRNVPTGGGHGELRYSVMPFAGGSESALGVPGVALSASWSDSVTVAVATQAPGGQQLTQIDVRTGAGRNALSIPDSVVRSIAALPDGWSWIPASSDRIMVRRAGRAREYPKPPVYAFLFGVVADPARERLFLVGSDKATGDSLVMSALSLADGTVTPWAAITGETMRLTPLQDGSVMVVVTPTPESIAFFKATGPGQLQKLGASSRAQALTVSADLKRATEQSVDYRADAWLSKVIRQ